MTESHEPRIYFNAKALLVTGAWLGVLALASLGPPAIGRVVTTPAGLLLVGGLGAVSLWVLKRTPFVLYGILAAAVLLTIVRLVWKLVVFAWS